MKKIILLAILIIDILIAVLWWQTNTKPVDAQDTTKKTIIISQGSGVRFVAEQLEKEGLIRNQLAFLITVKTMGLEDAIQAGTFYLSPDMDATTIAKTLTVGKSDVRITIPEGKRAEEIAEIIVAKFPSLDVEALKAALLQHEGYLFPDTYDFTTDVTIEEIVTVLTTNFDRKYATINSSNKLSTKEYVIIASLIEREAKHAEDRPRVSSVLHNRLDIGMKLDIDATVQYALGYNFYERTWWKRNLTQDDLQIDSPYNTYINPGLPPGPIANPGLASLEAAMYPSETNYLFYISDKQGINRYARTLEEHNENIRRYGL